MTFIAALRYDRIEAPWLLDGPINGERFRTYVEKVLGPTLHPGDLVIMDNLAVTKAGPSATQSGPQVAGCSCCPNTPPT